MKFYLKQIQLLVAITTIFLSSSIVSGRTGSLLLTHVHKTWEGGKLFLYDMATGATDTLTRETTYGACFSPDAKKVAYTLSGKTSRIRIIDLFTRQIDSIGIPISNSTLTWANDGCIYHKNGWTRHVFKTNVTTGVVDTAYTLNMTYSPVSNDTQNCGIFTGYTSMDGKKGCYTVDSDQIGNRAVSMDYETGVEITINDGGDRRLSCQGTISCDGKYVASANYNHTLGFVKLHNNNGNAYRTIASFQFWMSNFSNDSPDEMIFRSNHDSGTYYYNVSTMATERICRGPVAWAYHAKGWVMDTLVPNPPTALSAVLTEKSVALTWIPPVANSATVTRYIVERNGVRVAIVSDPSYLDLDVTENSDYSYSVYAATNGVGVSLPATQLFRTAVDNTPPAIAAAFCFGTNMEILFTEPVDSLTAANKLNYQLGGGITIQTATRPSPKLVHLVLASAVSSLTDTMVRVSGVKDKSQGENVATAASAPITLVSSLWVSTGRTPRWACIDSGSLYWYDDTPPEARFLSRPPLYHSFPYFQTSWRDGTADSTADYMSFTISRTTDILIIGNPPLWAQDVSQWTNTGTKIDAHSVYSKTFNAGTVTLKGSGLGNYKTFVVGFRDPSLRPVAAESGTVATLSPSRQAATVYPVPFSQATRISYFLDRNSHVSIAVYDAKGQIVKELFDGLIAKGHHTNIWTGLNSKGEVVPNGVYISKVVIGGKEVSSKRMVFVR